MLFWPQIYIYIQTALVICGLFYLQFRNHATNILNAILWGTSSNFSIFWSFLFGNLFLFKRPIFLSYMSHITRDTCTKRKQTSEWPLVDGGVLIWELNINWQKNIIEWTQNSFDSKTKCAEWIFARCVIIHCLK